MNDRPSAVRVAIDNSVCIIWKERNALQTRCDNMKAGACLLLAYNRQEMLSYRNRKEVVETIGIILQWRRNQVREQEAEARLLERRRFELRERQLTDEKKAVEGQLRDTSSHIRNLAITKACSMAHDCS